MPHDFDFAASPFDCLSATERTRVREGIEQAVFRAGDALLEPGSEATRLYVLAEGHVREFDGDELVAAYGPDDAFDGRSLVAGRADHRFVAVDDVRAHALPKALVQDLIATNAAFGAMLMSDLTRKLATLAERRGQREMQALTMARVAQSFLRPACVVDAATDIVAVARVFQAQRTSCVLVRRGDSPAPAAIFTTTGLQRAILDGRPLSQLPVGELASAPLITVAADAPLFDALALMIKHRVHRLVVKDGERIEGLLEQLDALSFVSNHSYLITVRIAQADDLDALAAAAQQITRLVSLLHRGGTRVAQIARLVQALNARLFERAWQFIAPPALVDNSCLFVMGSEGRGEQLLKTDQDNGLVLRDGFDASSIDLEGVCERFSAALMRFGFPECPGDIMVRNPLWRMSESGFADRAQRWLLQPDPQGLMALAIFLDAQPVAGDGALLTGVRDALNRRMSEDDSLLSRFASAIDAFPDAEGLGWWNRLLPIGGHDAPGVDLKKAGLFPIVHGVRSLALQAHVCATGTVERLDALVREQRLGAAFAADLADSLHLFMELRLRGALAELELDRPVSGRIVPDDLSSLDRALLKDALSVVKHLRTVVRHQFHLSHG